MANATLQDPRPVPSQDAKKEGSSLKATFRVGAISVAMFTDGNVSLRRGYRTPTGEWKSTTSLRPGDVKPAIEALTQCLEAISAEKAETIVAAR